MTIVGCIFYITLIFDDVDVLKYAALIIVFTVTALSWYNVYLTRKNKRANSNS
jgi:hypothetical protein